MAGLRAIWESLCSPERTTIFQEFHWNLLAFTMFAGREEPHVVCAKASYGVAIVPAVIRRGNGTMHLLGEELFDYRGVLHQGEIEVLACALAALAQYERPLEMAPVRECDRPSVLHKFEVSPFSAAPVARCAAISPEVFAGVHGRLARNLRRLERLGFKLKLHDGSNSSLLRSIYQRKAAQDAASLFHDPIRIAFLINAALFHPKSFEIFTLERGPHMAAALVTLRDGFSRRFYTGWFDPEFKKFSPSMTLIYEVSRQSLAERLDCDYMTGEQSYKMRLATGSVPLYRLRATPEQLGVLAPPAAPELRLAS
jgi:CelD/BcsL family acetyltransferase involved in cellulose biosynthesis